MPDDIKELVFPYERTNWMVHLFVVLLVSGCAALGLWAWTCNLDVVSIAKGEVVPSGQVKKVQHLEGGIVKEIRIHEGDVVEKGETLIVLEGTASGADVDALSSRLASLKIDIIRLQAKANLQKHLEFPDELRRKYPKMVAESEALFKAELSKYLNDKKIQGELIRQREQDIKQIEVRLQNSKKNLKLIDEQISISEELLKEDLNDRYSHLSLMREYTNLKNQKEEDAVSLERTRAALKEEKSILVGLTSSYKEKARKLLDKKRQEYNELSLRLRKYRDQLKRTVMSAPVSGVVKSLNVYAEGEVIRPGDTVAEIVPEDDSLGVEALLLPGDVGYVHPDQKALITLASSDARRFGKIEGTVVRISPDTFTSQDGFSYYKVQIKPSRTFFSGNKGWKYELKPGVQVTSNILVGKRSVIDYFLEPFFGTLTSPLSEI